MAAQVNFHLVAIFAFLAVAKGWRCAKYKHYFSQQPDYIDCIWDCCGNSFNRHCCAPIGIIVGCSIVGAVIVASLTVIICCWWQRRRARLQKGPRLFHNRRHSHYPVAPTSVTRPAPTAPPYRGPPPGAGYGPGPGYRGPPQGYRQPPGQYYDSDRERQGYRPPPRPYYNEKPPLPPSDYNERVVGPPRPVPEQYYDSDRERPGYHPPRRPPYYSDKPPLPASDSESGPDPNDERKPPKSSSLFI